MVADDLYDENADIEADKDSQSPELFGFYREDKVLIERLIASVKELLKRPDMAPSDINGVAKLLLALQRFPQPTEGIDIDLGLKYHHKEHMVCYNFHIAADLFEVLTTEWIPGPAGGDSCVRTHFEVELDSYREVDHMATEAWLESFEASVDSEIIEVEILDYGDDSSIDWDDESALDEDLWSGLRSDDGPCRPGVALSGEEKAAVRDLLSDPKSSDPGSQAHRRDIRSIIAENFSRAEKLIITYYYSENRTMKEIGDILDVSESRVFQIHSSILQRLKEHLDKGKKEFESDSI